MTAARRILRIAGGWIALVLGVILIPLPGPGLLVILGGLTLLSRESRWARHLMSRLRKMIRSRRKDDDATEERPT